MSQNKTCEDLYQKKPIQILKTIRKTREPQNKREISREAETTTAHGLKIFELLETLDLVTFKEDGRQQLVDLTKKGEDVADHLIEIENIINGVDI